MKRLLVFGLLAAFHATVHAKIYVAVPETDWTTVVPYVRANILAELNGDRFEVYVCPAHTDRSVVDPFDEVLSDFARVLITETMRHDAKVVEAIDGATRRFRERLPKLTADERRDYRLLYWQSLTWSTDVLSRLATRFEKAKAQNRLRCWVCEQDPSYAPAGEHH